MSYFPVLFTRESVPLEDDKVLTEKEEKCYSFLQPIPSGNEIAHVNIHQRC